MKRFHLMSGAAAVAGLMAVSAPAGAQALRAFDIPAGALADGLNRFAAQSGQQIFFTGDLVAGRRTPGLRGPYAPADALNRLLEGSGLAWTETRPGVIVLRRSDARAAVEGEAAELSEVVVTGTLLRHAGDIASPVVRLDREALDRRGFATVAEALVDLPQNFAGSTTPVVALANADPGASNTVQATGINLRGLGPASTLVLVNGRRLAGSGSRAEFADLSALPSAAVERVDVLLDGASALYGADAVAGVVNVIMRSRFDGQETRLRAAAARGGGEDLMVSHLAGTAWDGGSAYLAVEHQQTHGLSSFDRPFTADGDLRPWGGSDRRFLYGTPGNIVAFNATRGVYESRFAIRPNASGRAEGPGDFAAGQANLQSSTYGTDLIPALVRTSAYGRVRQTLGDRLELTGDVRYNHRAYAVTGPAIGGVYTVTQANPWFVSPTGATSHTVGYAFQRELGGTRQRGTSESLGVTAGLRYDLTDAWSLDAYLAWAGERGEQNVTNRIHSRRLNEALGTLPDDPATAYRASVDGYLNLFGDGTVNSRAVLDFIGGGYSRAWTRSRAWSANVLAQGTAGRLPGGDVAVAIGLQTRTEDLESRSVNFAASEVPAPYAVPRRDRSVSAVFAEARLPLVGPDNARPGVRRLDLSVAGRLEHYDDFGETFNPKLGVVWSPRDRLNVRASWGTSFRAASLPHLFDLTQVSSSLLPLADGSRVLVLQRHGGNPDLKPETAETLSAGIDYQPRGGPAFSLNLFETRFTDRIARPVTENINGVLFDPTLAPFVTRVNPGTSPADRALVESFAGIEGFPAAQPIENFRAIVDARWVNTGAVTVRGLDLSGRQGFDLGAGHLALDASASWILDYETRPTPTAAVRSVAGLIGYPVKLRGRAGATWSQGDLTAGAHWNHVDAYRDRAGVRIDAWDTVDLQIGWSPDRGALRGTRVSLTVQNALDADPPFYNAPTGYGFDAGQASLLGRVVALQLTRRW